MNEEERLKKLEAEREKLRENYHDLSLGGEERLKEVEDEIKMIREERQE